MLPNIPESNQLLLAKKQLENTIFGLQSRFNQSLCLIYYSLKLPDPFSGHEGDHLIGSWSKKVSNKDTKPEVTAALLEKIRQQNTLDFALLDFAEDLFRRRVAALKTLLDHSKDLKAQYKGCWEELNS